MAEGSTDRHRLILMPSGRRGDVAPGTDLLRACEDLGVDLESICGGRQNCGKCVVEPEFGSFSKHGIKSEVANLSPVEAAEDRCAREHGVELPEQRLACAADIRGDILIHVPDSSLARKQVIRKEAGELRLDIEPALRLIYLEVGAAQMGGGSAEERLRHAAKEQWSLEGITVDPPLLSDLREALEKGEGEVTLTLWHDRDVVRIEPGYRDGIYGLAVDIGSTTLAGHLSDLRTGELLASSAVMNPQVRYGEDLMSRVSYAMTEQQGTARMHRAAVRAVNELAEATAAQAEIKADEICDLVLVGNSVMHHLALGINPTDLGFAPFALTYRRALDAPARDFGFDRLHPGARLHVPPCIAGHVGADCAAVLLSQADQFDEKVTLVVDIGTNAEIMLAQGDRLLVASSPTGPALEGAQIQHGQRAAPGAIERVRIDPNTGRVRYRVVGDPRWNDELEEGESLRPSGICGSGILEAVGELFSVGWLEASGRLAVDGSAPEDWLRPTGRTAELLLAPAAESASAQDIVVTQNDVRAVQLAKAALYAGARLLMDQMDVEHVDRVRLAGAFGSYIDPKYALILGLIPDCDPDAIEAVGNAAGDGARIALLNRRKRVELQELAEQVEYVETATEARFQEHFVDAMGLPHSSAPFPHAWDLLSSSVARIQGEELGRRSRRPVRKDVRKKRRSS